MEREKGATTTDKAAHVAFDRIEFCNVQANNKGHYCRKCGTQLQTMYHEERLYSVHCPVCETVTLVKAGSPGAAEGMVGLNETEFWSTDMQKDEAIYRIRDHMRVHRIGTPPHIHIKQALDMAIHALLTQGELPQEKQQRLDAYEATGLCPQEITALKLYAMGAAVAEIQEFDGVPIARLQELAKAEKEGRLLIVPAPGDVLYETDPAHGVVKHTVTDVHWAANTSAVDDTGMAWADYYTEEDIHTAHLNREAAEAVLAAGSIMEG